MINKILVPRLGVNDDYIVVGEWMVQQGDYVKLDQELAILENSKETSIFLSPFEGYLTIYVNAQEEAKVGDLIAIIADTPDNILSSGTSLSNSVEKNLSEIQYTKRAKELIEKSQIDLTLLPDNQLITEKDVEKLIARIQPYHIQENKSNVVLLYGRGGFCKTAIDIIEQSCCYRIHGIIEYHYPETEEIYGVKVIGNDDDLLHYYEEGYHKILNVVMSRHSQYYRKPPYDMLKKIGFECINLVHRNATVERTVIMGEGNIICAGAVIGSDVRIGSNCIVNCNAVVSHDCIISDSCHIASGAILASGVVVGENTLIGQGCTIYNDVKIGSNVIVKNGSHIFGDISSDKHEER